MNCLDWSLGQSSPVGRDELAIPVFESNRNPLGFAEKNRVEFKSVGCGVQSACESVFHLCCRIWFAEHLDLRRFITCQGQWYLYGSTIIRQREVSTACSESISLHELVSGVQTVAFPYRGNSNMSEVWVNHIFVVRR